MRNEEEALNCLFEGESRKTLAATRMNENSSRAHCVYTLHVERKSQAASAEKVRIAVKYVQNSKYKGDILMYPIDWLDYYFSKKETKQDESDELYELPF